MPKEMKIYVVIRRGVYLQGIVGVFDNEEKATSAMNLCKKHEPDNYHSFSIIETELNKLSLIEYDGGGWMDEDIEAKILKEIQGDV